MIAKLPKLWTEGGEGRGDQAHICEVSQCCMEPGVKRRTDSSPGHLTLSNQSPVQSLRESENPTSRSGLTGPDRSGFFKLG